jgi:hypothetical protein
MFNLGDIKSRMNFTEEVNNLLGAGRGTARKCFNTRAHSRGDKSPSLSFSPATGAWRCHACGEAGDIFKLYQKIHGGTFVDVLRYYADKLGVQSAKFEKASATKTVAERNIIGEAKTSHEFLLGGSEKALRILEFIQLRYSITPKVIARYKIGWSEKRDRMIVPVHRIRPGFDEVVNLRMHDVLRLHCSWHKDGKPVKFSGTEYPGEITLEDVMTQTFGPLTPKWDRDRAGKVVGVSGHNTPYPYPIETFIDNNDLVLVGGENKALALISAGVPSFCFTGGEGCSWEPIFEYCAGKKLRILFDADYGKPLNKDGWTRVQEMGLELAKKFANAGAVVKFGRWPEEVSKSLPHGSGDISDLLVLNDGDAKASLDQIDWVPVERDVESHKSQDLFVGRDPMPMEIAKVEFSNFINPLYVNEWGEVHLVALGSGSGQSLVKSGAEITCPEGQRLPNPKCNVCSLPKNGHHTVVESTMFEVLRRIGMPESKYTKDLMLLSGVAEGCRLPVVAWKYVSTQIVVVAPSIDSKASVRTYTNAVAIAINDGTQPNIIDGTNYRVIGRPTQDPKTGHAVIAMQMWEETKAGVLTFDYDEGMHQKVYSSFGRGLTPDAQIDRILTMLEAGPFNGIKGQRDMILTVMLSWFAPIAFRIWPHQESAATRCPMFLVLGDTTTGKSTVARAAHNLYSAGAWLDMGASPTMAGIIGGQAKIGNQQMFAWGALPSADRTIVVMDEFNKAPVELIGNLTALVTEGIASRTIVGFNRKIASSVRMLCLANPREIPGRPSVRLSSAPDPLRVINELYATPQDVRRVDLACIVMQSKDTSHLYGEVRPKDIEYKNFARYHLSWAWTRGEEDFVFENALSMQSKAIELASKLGDNLLLLPQQAVWKIGRIAAAFAMLRFSTDKDSKVVVTDRDVDFALHVVNKFVGKYIVSGGSSANGPVAAIFDKVDDYTKLEMFSKDFPLSIGDIVSVFKGNTGLADQLISVCVYQMRYWSLSRKSGNYELTANGRSQLLPFVEEYLLQRLDRTVKKTKRNDKTAKHPTWDAGGY